MISVIVPFYQTEERLFDACVNSILADNTADIELIIADDGSAAEYRQVCEKFLSDGRVRVLHLPHKGVSAARNAGIEAAAGEWITFVDSDDLLSEGWYKEVSDFSAGRSDDLIIFTGGADRDGVCYNNNFFIKENVDYGQDPELKRQVMESAISVGILPRGFKCCFSLGSPCAKLYRTEFMIKNDLRFDTEITFAEDTHFSLCVYNKAEHIVYKEAYIYRYVVNTRSVTRRYRSGLSREMTVFFRRTKQFLTENGLYEGIKNGYETRVCYEISRVMNLEFYNKGNTDSKKVRNQKVKEFLDQDPYCYVVQDALKGKFRRKDQIFIWMLIHGLYPVVCLFKTVRKKLK